VEGLETLSDLALPREGSGKGRSPFYKNFPLSFEGEGD